MTQVPLVIYDNAGNRKIIGTADVVHKGNGFEISGEVTDKDYIDLIRVDNPDWYSIGFDPEGPIEATIVPPHAIPKPLYMNIFDKKD